MPNSWAERRGCGGLALALYLSRVGSGDVSGIAFREVATKFQELVVPREIDTFTLILGEPMDRPQWKAERGPAIGVLKLDF